VSGTFFFDASITTVDALVTDGNISIA